MHMQGKDDRCAPVWHGMETGKKEKPKRGVERGGRGEESISVRLYRNFESGGSWCQCSCSPGDRVRGWLPGHEGFLNGGYP